MRKVFTIILAPWSQTSHITLTDTYIGNPLKTFDYVELIPRLMLQYSDPDRAKTFMTYRKEAEQLSQHEDPKERKLVDFWGSRLHRDLKEEGLFTQDTNLGFFFSTDGIDIFRERTSFDVWPLILVNLSLPPAIRYVFHSHSLLDHRLSF